MPKSVKNEHPTEEVTPEILEETKAIPDSEWQRTEETSKIPPVAQNFSRFGPQGGSKFGKWAINFNPPNKQRPGRAAGRGR